MRSMLSVLISLAFAASFAGCDLLTPPASGSSGQPAGDNVGDSDPDPEAPACTYPSSSGLIGVGSIMPQAIWRGAYLPEGSTVDFDLNEVYCGDTWAGVDTIFFVLVAEWCPNCPDYLRALAPQARQIAQAGGLVVIVDVEDRAYTLPSSESCHNYVSGYVGGQLGMRVGEADADPMGVIYESRIWSAVPNAFVVRTRDMQVIASQEDTPYVLPFVPIAQHPEADWSDPSNPPFFSACGPDDEEALEPNDVPEQASVLEPGTVVTGGICNEAPDFYQVDIDGAWRVDLAFSHAVGDLDVYVVDPSTGEPLKNGTQRVGSESSTDDESFEHEGPATLMVVGFQNASAPYTLTLSEL